MIKRFPGNVPTRSRAVAHDGLVYAVTPRPTKSPSLYEQTRDALAAIDKTLAEAGSTSRASCAPRSTSPTWAASPR